MKTKYLLLAVALTAGVCSAFAADKSESTKSAQESPIAPTTAREPSKKTIPARMTGLIVNVGNDTFLIYYHDSRFSARIIANKLAEKKYELASPQQADVFETVLPSLKAKGIKLFEDTPEGKQALGSGEMKRYVVVAKDGTRAAVTATFPR